MRISRGNEFPWIAKLPQASTRRRIMGGIERQIPPMSATDGWPQFATKGGAIRRAVTIKREGVGR